MSLHRQDCTQELLANREEYILQRGFELARLLEDAGTDDPRREALPDLLIELSGETKTYFFHPNVVEAFFRQAVMTALRKGKDGKPDVRTQLILNEIQALVNKSTPQELVEEIANKYNRGDSPYQPSAAYKAAVVPPNFHENAARANVLPFQRNGGAQ